MTAGYFQKEDAGISSALDHFNRLSSTPLLLLV
jgi:hypothetical protein